MLALSISPVKIEFTFVLKGMRFDEACTFTEEDATLKDSGSSNQVTPAVLLLWMCPWGTDGREYK